MRLIEEKKNYQLQIIASILLLVSTVLVQVSDFCISKHENNLTSLSLVLLNKHIIRDNYSRDAHFYTIYQSLPGLNIEVNKELLDSPGASYVDDEEKQLLSKLHNKEINEPTFLKKQIENKKKRSGELLYEFNQGVTLLNSMRSKGTIWVPLKKFLFIPLQVFFIIIIMVGYYQLLKSVADRIEKPR